MRKTLLPVLAVAVAAAGCHESPADLSPTPAMQSADQADAPVVRMRWMDPVTRLLEQREQLALSADQVARLEVIQQRLEQQNAPLVAQLPTPAERGAIVAGAGVRGERRAMILREPSPEQREQIQSRMEAHGRRMQELSPEERAELRERMEARMQEFRGRAAERPDELPDHVRARILERRGEPLDPEQREEHRQQLEQMRNEMREHRERMAELRPVLEQLHANGREAMEEARAVLTDEQRAQLEARRGLMLRERHDRGTEGRRLWHRVRPDEGEAGS